MKKSCFSFFVLILIVFTAFFISPSVFGQSYRLFSSELDQIMKRAKWQIGPFKVYPTIQFRNIGYDDNVYYQQEEDNPVSDYTGTVSPEIRVYLLFRNRLILSFLENPEYVFYLKEKRERAFNNRYSPRLKILLFNRFVLSGDYHYSKRRRRASSEFDMRTDELVKGCTGQIFSETARGTSFGFSGSIEKIRYEDIPGQEIPLSDTLNREERSGHLEFYYRIFSESYFFISGGYTEYNFEDPQAHWRNSRSYQVYSGIRFPLLGKVRGTLSLGYKKFVPKTEGRKRFSGIVGNTNLDFRIWRFNFRLNYSRDNPFSYSTNIYFIEDRYGGGISFYLTEYLRVDYNLNYGESNYPEPFSFQTPEGKYEEIKRKDKYYIHTLGFVFRVVDNIGIGLMLNFWKRSSNYLWENRGRMFIGGYVTYEF